MDIFIAQVANYFGLGNTRTNHADGSWMLDNLCCKLGRYTLRLEQHQTSFNRERHKGQQVHTTQIAISGIKNYSEGKTVAQDVCALLSLVSLSQVVAFEFSFGECHEFHSVRGVSMRYRPLLDTVDGDCVVSFLQQVWPSYRKMKMKRKLYAVIDMLSFTDAPSRPLELKLAQVFIILENLKGTFAHSHGIPFCDGNFRVVGSSPKANLKKEKVFGFHALLKEMLKEVGMRCSLKGIIKLRNEIIHFGLSRKSYRSMNSHYDNAQDIIREYLLRLLGFKGNFIVYSKACRASKTLV